MNVALIPLALMLYLSNEFPLKRETPEPLNVAAATVVNKHMVDHNI